MRKLWVKMAALPVLASSLGFATPQQSVGASSRYVPLACTTVERNSGSNDVIRNACGHVIEAHWRDVNGSWSMFSVYDSYTVYGARVAALWACHKNDSFDRSTGMCVDNDGSDRW